MNELADQARAIATKFRIGHAVEAETQLPDYVDQLIKANRIEEQQLSNLIISMLGCQEQKDWLGLADYLEYELIYLLGEC